MIAEFCLSTFSNYRESRVIALNRSFHSILVPLTYIVKVAQSGTSMNGAESLMRGREAVERNANVKND